MQLKLLQLRRMIISNADRFPEVARSWYENGFGRVLATLGTAFHSLAERGVLQVEDPLLAANHFVGLLLLWIPVNRAMFGAADATMSQTEIQRHAREASKAFLDGYRSPKSGLA